MTNSDGDNPTENGRKQKEGVSGLRNVFIGSLEKSAKEIEDEFSESRCGFGSCSPQWLQGFATKQGFMLIFSILAIIQGMSFTYFAATLTTLEKRLKITSETATLMMSGNEVSQILFSIPLSYFGGKGHRPRWMGAGTLLSALSCFLLASPHLIYGPGEDALSLTEEFYANYHTHGNNSWMDTGTLANSSISDSTNLNRSLATEMKEIKEGLCDREGRLDLEKNLDCDPSDQSLMPLVLIFMSQFTAGIGVMLFFVLGGPYMDDQMPQTQMPFLMGLTMSFRLIGPIVGFLFGSFCLKIFISPSLTPRITSDNPKWIGAWWLGWNVLGSLMAVMSICIAIFPKELRKGKKHNVETESKNNYLPDEGTTRKIIEKSHASLKDMKTSLKGLILNKVNLYNNLAAIFYLFPIVSFGLFMPKYLEAIYKITAAEASLISGPTIGVPAIGYITSGFLISKFQPTARKLAGFNVFTGIFFVLVLVSFTQITCHQGSPDFEEGRLSWKANLTQECNKDCNCQQGNFDPICYPEQDKIFYSPCTAGCLNYDKEIGIIMNCSCLPTPEIILSRGTCTDKSRCKFLFYMFIGIRTLISFVDSFGRIGNMLIQYRCVHPQLKSLAVGFAVFCISVFASFPSPLVFGAVIDSVCLLWGKKCGEKGNCLLYDSHAFVYAFNFTAAGFVVIGVLFDSLVWYHVKDLDLYNEKNNPHTKDKDNKDEQLSL